MGWFIGGTLDFWGRGHGLESGISHNDLCVICRTSQGTERDTYPSDKKKSKKERNYLFNARGGFKFINLTAHIFLREPCHPLHSHCCCFSRIIKELV